MAKTTTPGTTPGRKKEKTPRLNARLYTFVSKVITPAVLLLGLLFLALFHFRGVLASTQATDNIYKDQQAYSLGAMSYKFQQLAGIDRPNISYNGVSLISFVDWSSTISIDGNAVNLWDNYHGYDYNRQSTNATQVFATTSGSGWQVAEVVTLTDSHTVTIQYYFTAMPVGIAEPHHVELTIQHYHQTWLNPTVQNNTFTAGVLTHEMSSVTSGNTPTPVGTMTLSVSGPAVPQNAIALTYLHGNLNATGVYPTLTDAFTTTYVIDNPDVNRLTPLGTETITFTPGAPASTPVSGPVPVPTP